MNEDYAMLIPGVTFNSEWSRPGGYAQVFNDHHSWVKRGQNNITWYFQIKVQVIEIFHIFNFRRWQLWEEGLQ